MTDHDTRVRQALEAYRAAVEAKDADALLRLYAPDVRVFDAWGAWSYDGAAAWRVAVEGWFASLGAERCRVAFDDVRILADGRLAAMSAIVTYAGISPQGETRRAMQNRISWVLQVRGHVLRVATEHTSAPIGFEDGKAILQRRVDA